MQVKKYTASNMQEAIKMIKEDLGSRAIIISTRKIRKGTGAFGMFGQHVLEITAARDERPKPVNPNEYNGLLKQQQQKTEYETEILQNPPKTPRKIESKQDPAISRNLQEDISELKEMVTDLRKGHRRKTNDSANVTHLRYELSELKNLVTSLVNQSSILREDDLHENLIALYQQLCFNGVEDKFARRLIEEVRKKIPKQEIGNFSYVKIYVARMFMQVIKTNPAPTAKNKGAGKKPKILTFLGPTGVGKTTTLAKIAGVEKIEHPDLKIGLITLDTFRIAAVQQLQEYARIINVPIRVVNDRIQLDHALAEFKKKDLILIDTAGRSQRDESQMSELRDILIDQKSFDNLLVLSATTKDNDQVEITKRFSTIPLSGVVFTKLDESTSYGSIFNHSIRFKLPLTYLTTGQNVPDDIENASRDRLIDLLLNISAMDA
ncbi:MAG: flagellar biosynthesis protein FlhF [Deltaproteobacteria bacterium]|jgi:flagellar biosynthesis protein FlhF|nr:flagellar biosynthesis protein FlhF [Deltaproteobacteria bacterium]MBT4090007.1 flagellar biosynthesis protein FlhF [Deltaproteobacteria bacterium]MBT4264535.1 flagellar biosynthesis protein FlhF [Deltaproteobacteria bacterium]MBT4638484.1 flagellar biosynthesis protein FlhF [Deltaproteobacteria bacterium]MBT6500715.1 flagellar biosynthesis protein FlhF [Deltaproteobacteria bacterium]